MVDFDKMLRESRARRAAGEPRPNSPEDLGIRKERVPDRGQAKRRGSSVLRQTLGPDDAFGQIAQDAIAACDRVECDREAYVQGLRYLLGEVEIALQAAKETMPDV